MPLGTFKKLAWIQVKEAVQTAIRNDLPNVAEHMTAGKLTIRTITINGTEVTYNAMKLPSGVINVGRITVPK